MNLIGLFFSQNMITKYDINLNPEIMEKTIQRLTNQMWKLIPMRENKENWTGQLETVIIEIVGLNEICLSSHFLQLLCKLEGLKNYETNFNVYRKTVFESISLL